MAIQSLTRVFSFKDSPEIKDPNPNMTVEEVRDFLSNQYPALTNASVEAPAYKDTRVLYEFKTNLGQKG